MSPSACRAYVANFGILWQFFSPLLGFPLSSRGAMAHPGVTLTSYFPFTQEIILGFMPRLLARRAKMQLPEIFRVGVKRSLSLSDGLLFYRRQGPLVKIPHLSIFNDKSAKIWTN